MNSLGIPHDRIAKRLGLMRTSLHYHLSKMAKLPNSTNTDLSQGFTVFQVAEKHNWTEPMVWSLAQAHPRSTDSPHPLLLLETNQSDP
jgi:hypothetical protein